MADSDAQVLAETIVNYADRGNQNTITLANQTLSFDHVLQPGHGIKIMRVHGRRAESRRVRFIPARLYRRLSACRGSFRRCFRELA